MIGGIGIQEILIVLIVGLLVFGAARLPKIARSLGLGIKEFKKTIKSIEGEDDEKNDNKIKYVDTNPPQQQYHQTSTGSQNQNAAKPSDNINPQNSQNNPNNKDT